jgi:hypothetical protein
VEFTLPASPLAGAWRTLLNTGVENATDPAEHNAGHYALAERSMVVFEAM